MGIRDRLKRRVGRLADRLGETVSRQPYSSDDLKRTNTATATQWPLPTPEQANPRPSLASTQVTPPPEEEPKPEVAAEAEEEAPPINLEPVSDEDAERIESDVVTTLKTIFDPEIPVDIYELGLIYGIDVSDGPSVNVKMTLTSPNCPAAQSLPAEVKQKTGAVDGVVQASVDIVWEPAWSPEMMSEEAQLELNL